jgi:hypothetical protein
LLTPLYVLGVLAVAAPIVFHLIRRSPRGEVPFSSLMFLAPTPPRLTRRSRLDHLFLLLLRATALCLLALAFARPFFRQAARLDLGEVQRQRIAVLIDTSASMKRGDLWARAKALAKEAIAACRPTDELALFSFDVASRPLLSFDESATLDPARRQAVAVARLDQLAPTWGSTHLGQALIDAVAAIEDVADASQKTGQMPRKVVLVSDLQQGSRLDVLGDFEWPSDVELDLRNLSVPGSNAGLQWLAESVETDTTERAPGLRVRIANDPASRHESFELFWADENGATAGKAVPAYVPPGESRVVRIALPSGPLPPRQLRLKGDAHEFDNTLFLAAEPREEATVVYLGNDAADDPSGLLYYLQRVFQETPRRTVRVIAKSPASALAIESVRSVPLLVLSAETTTENVGRLKDYAERGGTVLAVLATPGRAASLATLVGAASIDVAEAGDGRDMMLGEISFSHPVFSAFAPAQFNDFTKIHFWKHRRIRASAAGDARVIARFENGDPAVLEKPLGKGRLIVLTSGWNPADSQLARSSKFVPLMAALLEGTTAHPSGGALHQVYDRVPLPVVESVPGRLLVHKPDGTAVKPAQASMFFAETDQPGVYLIDTPDGARSFAVNLDPAESKTSPLAVETLEQFGCRLTNVARQAAEREHLRQLHNAELEGRQKLWRWVILAAIGVLVLETLVAGRLRQPRLADTANNRAEAFSP